MARLAEHPAPTHHSHEPSGTIAGLAECSSPCLQASFHPTVSGGNMKPTKGMLLEHLALVAKGNVFQVPTHLKQLKS